MANGYITVEAQRSRYFGPKGSYVQRGNGFVENNLESDIYFQQIIDSHIVQHLAQGLNADEKQIEAGYVKGYNTYLAARRRREGRPRPDVPRPGLGEADHAARQLTCASTSSCWSRAATWRSAASPRRPRRRRHRPRSPAAAQPGAHRAGARRRLAGTHEHAGQQRGRDRVRGHQGPPRPPARQPALPVDRHRALLPGAAHHPRQDQRHRGVAVRRPARPHRPQRERGVEPHRVDRVPVHPVPAHARQGPPDGVPAERQGRGHDPAHGDRDGEAGRTASWPRSRTPSGGPATARSSTTSKASRCRGPPPPRSPSPTPTPTTSPGRSTPGSASTARRAPSRCCRS